MVMLYVFTIIAIIVFLLAVYILRRNRKVYKFVTDINELCYKHDLRRIEDKTYYKSVSAYYWFGNKYSYERYVFSFKPLKLENWFTKEEIERIKQ